MSRQDRETRISGSSRLAISNRNVLGSFARRIERTSRSPRLVSTVPHSSRASRIIMIGPKSCLFAREVRGSCTRRRNSSSSDDLIISGSALTSEASVSAKVGLKQASWYARVRITRWGSLLTASFRSQNRKAPRRRSLEKHWSSVFRIALFPDPAGP